MRHAIGALEILGFPKALVWLGLLASFALAPSAAAGPFVRNEQVWVCLAADGTCSGPVVGIPVGITGLVFLFVGVAAVSWSTEVTPGHRPMASLPLLDVAPLAHGGGAASLTLSF
jgi:hypothetical protein